MRNFLNKQLIGSAIVTSAVLGYSAINAPAQAAIMLKSFTTPGNVAPDSFDTKAFSLQGRIGGNNTYEFNYEAVTNGGAVDQTIKSGTIEENWVNNQGVNWQLDWNPATKIASFQLTSANNATVITSQFTGSFGTGTGKFDGFSLLARALTSGSVVPGSISAVDISEITLKKKDNTIFTDSNFIITPDSTNPGPTSLSASATAPTTGQNLDKSYFALDDASYDEILQLKGTGLMSWPSGDPLIGGNSRLTFQVDGFNAVPPVNPTATPEPTAWVSLLSVGAIVTLGKRLRK